MYLSLFGKYTNYFVVRKQWHDLCTFADYFELKLNTIIQTKGKVYF